MKTRNLSMAVLISALFLLSSGLCFSADTNTAPASPVKLIFIHHSCGENWLHDSHGGLGIALRNNNYFVSDTNYGWGPMSIGDNTDIGHWYEWFLGSSSSTYLSALYNESSQHSSYSRLSTDPGGENEIIMFKSCFPNSYLGGSPTDTPTTGDNPLQGQDAYSEHMTVGNAKGIYNDLLTYFANRQDKLFIVITAPPQTVNATDSSHAANARALNDWLVNAWLTSYSHNNVAVFDFYNVLTATNNHHRFKNGAVERVINTASNTSAYASDPWDSHPNATGNQKATGEFIDLLNVFYNRWTGGGETGVPPTANAGSAQNVTEGAIVTLNGSDSTDPDDGIDTYQWSQVSGSSVTLSDTTAIKPTFMAPSVVQTCELFTFQLTVTDQSGRHSSDTVSITVCKAAGPTCTPDGDIAPLGSPDGVVNVGDALIGLRFALSLEPGHPTADELCHGDVAPLDSSNMPNPDGHITVGDALVILRRALGLISFSPIVSSDQLTQSDFTYQGAFRLPSDFNWGARGLSFYPNGNSGAGSLLATGFDLLYDPAHPGESCWDPAWNCSAFFGEVGIPAPAKESNWENLPEATLLTQMTSFDCGLAAGVHREYLFVSGIEYVPQRGSQSGDKIYGSINLWYAEGVAGENTFPTVWFANMNGTNAQGMFHVGPEETPYHGRKMGSYLFSVPTWYAAQYLGGRTLITGRSRGTPADSFEDITTRGGSQGPTLFAFHAWDSDSPTGDLDALPVLYYRVKFPGCAGPNVGDPNLCDYPNYTMCDEWTGGSFVEASSKRAIILLGYKGLGSNCYDEPPVECNDPCSDSHGYHCNPYERQVIFYDVEQLGKRALGQQDPWVVLPYEIWRPNEFYLGDSTGHTCADVGGMAFDSDGKRVFMIEKGLGGCNNENAAVVHVWTVQ